MALRFASVLLCAIFAVGLGVAIPAPPPTGQCGQNAQRRSCGSACAPTCANPNPGPICVLPCVDACFCNQGFLKAANGECVKPQDCDAVPRIPMQIPNALVVEEEKNEVEKPKCGENEEYRDCAPSCTPTCAMPLPKPWCSLRCSRGCVCKNGYLRNREGKCIPALECGKFEDAIALIDIPLHEVTLKPKGAGPVNIPLQKVTLKPRGAGPVNIPLQKITLKPKGAGPINIPLEKAPLQPRCSKENEEYNACGVQLDCLANCEPPTSPKCKERMCTPGCVCRQPFVRHQDGRCVEKTQCPKTNPFAQA